MKKILGVITLVLVVIFLILLFKARSGKEIIPLIKSGEIKRIMEKPKPSEEIEFLEEKTLPPREMLQEEKVKEGKIREIRLKDISQEPPIPDVLPEVSAEEKGISPKEKMPTKKELEEMGRKGIIIY